MGGTGGGLAMEPRILQKKSSFFSSYSDEGGTTDNAALKSGDNSYSKNKGSGI